MSLEEQVEKCQKIHDTLAEYWNWVYYNTPHSDCSWLLEEYVKQLKPDVEHRVPVIMQELEELLKQHTERTFSILDVGCGVGGFIQKAIEMSSNKFPHIDFKATGIDISNKMLERASHNLSGLNAEIVCDSIANRSLNLRNEPFDVAIMMVTLSFYNDDNATDILRATRDKLKKEGCIVVMDFAWSYRWEGQRLFSKPLQKVTDMFFSHLLGESFHFENRTEDRLKTLFQDAGFEVAKSYLSEKTSKMKGMLVILAAKGTKIQSLREEHMLPEEESQLILAPSG